MYTPLKHVLECQDCGMVLRELSKAEYYRVAANPYNFIVYCFQCGKYHEEHPSM